MAEDREICAFVIAITGDIFCVLSFFVFIYIFCIILERCFYYCTFIPLFNDKT